jgi:hypothetical protein
VVIEDVDRRAGGTGERRRPAGEDFGVDAGFVERAVVVGVAVVRPVTDRVDLEPEEGAVGVPTGFGRDEVVRASDARDVERDALWERPVNSA